jgi:hypothetical protein
MKAKCDKGHKEICKCGHCGWCDHRHFASINGIEYQKCYECKCDGFESKEVSK